MQRPHLEIDLCNRFARSDLKMCSVCSLVKCDSTISRRKASPMITKNMDNGRRKERTTKYKRDEIVQARGTLIMLYIKDRFGKIPLINVSFKQNEN